LFLPIHITPKMVYNFIFCPRLVSNYALPVSHSKILMKLGSINSVSQRYNTTTEWADQIVNEFVWEKNPTLTLCNWSNTGKQDN